MAGRPQETLKDKLMIGQCVTWGIPGSFLTFIMTGFICIVDLGLCNLFLSLYILFIGC